MRSLTKPQGKTRSSIIRKFHTDARANLLRGPLGAILLLFRTKGRSLAALGAVLIVLLLAIDTFLQQVVDFPNRLTLQKISGTLPRIVEYRPPFTPSYYSGFESTGEDRAIAAVTREFFYGNGTQPVPFGNGTRPDVPLTCPTSNCVWPLYETLAVCSRCTEVSDMIRPQYACLNTTVDWSVTWWPQSKKPYPRGIVCGYFLNSTSSKPILLSGYVQSSNDSSVVDEALIVRTVPLTDFDNKGPYFGDGSVGFKDIRWPILDVLISSTTNGSQSAYSHEAPIVNECMLTWCVNTINSSYAAGQYQEKIVSTYLEPRTSRDPWPWTGDDNGDISPDLVYTQNLTLAPPNPRPHDMAASTVDTSYGIDNVTQGYVMFIFDDFFPAFYTAAHVNATPKLRFKNYMAGAFVRELEFNPWQQPNNISRHMERLATAMTNVVRSSVSRKMLEGEAYQMEPYISIRWEWLTFPFTLLLLSLVFLVLTIIRTSGDGAARIWKTSAMPTLIYSLPKETQSQFASSSTWGSGKGAPRKTRIKLLPNLGWRVSGQNYLSHSPRLPSGDRVPRGWI